MHVAAYMRDVVMVKCIVQLGVDVNAVDKSKRVALHFAAMSGHYNVVKLLLENSADVNAVTEHKWHHFTSAMYGHVDVANVVETVRRILLIKTNGRFT